MTLTLPIYNTGGQPLKISFKKLFFPFLLLIVVIVVLVKFSELREIGRLFTQAKWQWLALAFCSQLLNFILQGKVYQTIFRLLKLPAFTFLKLIKSAVTIIFLNFTIPSLGFAGNIYFLKVLKKHGLKEGKGLMIIILEFICFYTAFVLLLVLSLIYLFFKLGNIGYAQKIAVGGFAALLLLIAYLIYFFLGNKKRARKRVLWLAKKIDKTEDGISQEERVQELLNDFYEDFKWLKKNKKAVVRPAIIQFVKFLTDGLTIYLIFLAFGFAAPIGLGVVGFILGKMFSFIFFIPGGLGTCEGAMVLIFHSLGIHLELALAVTLIYRFFSYWLYFPLGLIFYRQLNKGVDKKLEIY